MALFKSDQKIDPKRQLQHELVEKEREYKQGLNTLRDLIAPSAFRVTQNSVEVSGKLARSFFVLTYPRFLSVDWLAPIISLDVPMDMSMFIYPMDTEEIMKKLRNKVGQVESNMRMGQEKGNVRDPMMETALQDIEGLRDRLQQGTEKYFRFSVYFTIYANEQKELDQATATLESILGSKLIVTKPAVLQMEQGFNSTLPLGNDELAIATNMNTEPLSTTFPFVSSELTSNDGILYGINRHNNGLILFDRFQMENANSVVFAKSGSGKSYAVKLEILRSL
ncbi:MAG: conjugal transfer protein TraC, partial [Candidatus Doudnabacteria bacterium]|nr:conjugal transfer protein TraC [Candidatus Doudnabacteria bacterium]